MPEIRFDLTKVKVVDTALVRPNTWNPKNKGTEDFQKVKKSIQLKGQRMPIIVRDTGEVSTPYEIIDGEQKWTACKELGFPKVLIYSEGQMSDKEAKELTIWYQMQVPFDETALAELVKEMTQYPDLELPYSDEEIADFSSLADFDWNQYKSGDDEKEFEPLLKTLSIKVNDEQYDNIMKAIGKKREQIDCPEGQCLESICNEYIERL